jgi:hypothetical protein
MQAIGTFGGARIGKRAVAFLAAVLAAFVLGGAGGYVARSVASEGAAPHSASTLSATLAESGASGYKPVRTGPQDGEGANSVSTPSYPADDGCGLINRHKAC